MKEIIEFISSVHPAGFYFKDLTEANLGSINWASLTMIEDPLVLKITQQRLGNVIQALINQGASPESECGILTDLPLKQIVGTLSDIALKARKIETEYFFLLIADEQQKA